MSPRTRDVIIAWALGLATLAALAALLTSCRTTSAESFTSVEMALVDHTARFAREMKVEVRGVITDTLSPYTDPNAFGWYSNGVAYYYRPRVARLVALIPTPGRYTVSSVAAHEVCHAVSHDHDIVHWNCMAFLATPTYPMPGSVRGAEQ